MATFESVLEYEGNLFETIKYVSLSRFINIHKKKYYEYQNFNLSIKNELLRQLELGMKKIKITHRIDSGAIIFKFLYCN